MGTYVSQEGEVGIPQSHLYPCLSLQGLPGLPGGVGQPGAVGEKVREGGQGTSQSGGGTTSPGWRGGCAGEPLSVCQNGTSSYSHFASCRVSQEKLEKQDPQEPQASL